MEGLVKQPGLVLATALSIDKKELHTQARMPKQIPGRKTAALSGDAPSTDCPLGGLATLGALDHARVLGLRKQTAYARSAVRSSMSSNRDSLVATFGSCESMIDSYSPRRKPAGE